MCLDPPPSCPCVWSSADCTCESVGHTYTVHAVAPVPGGLKLANVYCPTISTWWADGLPSQTLLITILEGGSPQWPQVFMVHSMNSERWRHHGPNGGWAMHFGLMCESQISLLVMDWDLCMTNFGTVI